MTGRATDTTSPAFVPALIFLFSMAFAAWILTVYPPEKVKIQQPVDKCVDGIVQSWDGNRWHPVCIKKTKRPVPCGEGK